eukprot:Blabericola_migrator_1__12592@NODE_800_length_6460_cov_108_099327_g568_i0_p1_GENE_NODE_800_length_6460_cov_108_099327_g568_i0NODE_800_length_6460_cov_108_099327_g568_i0_p1_ORF_typecomplete_len1339_score228_09ABC_tran/PF00005_27/1_3e39ABC_tran/PF00005_27/6_5e37ABC_membrane/PF00664_23/2_9e33ABC_membrane/PF00664_23/1_5e36SMC_N/PF02463_19/9_1SMC_N/PF02463_19/1_7e05SMC_N/PF02463_19/1_2e03SMC_N/PF02463_19/0_00013AAA/PF00004_29/0_00031AAA/PF00004_29/0_16AAA_21/PF13304_6/0_00094AAA_21/PF13304_6/0_77Rad1
MLPVNIKPTRKRRLKQKANFERFLRHSSDDVYDIYDINAQQESDIKATKIKPLHFGTRGDRMQGHLAGIVRGLSTILYAALIFVYLNFMKRYNDGSLDYRQSVVAMWIIVAFGLVFGFFGVWLVEWLIEAEIKRIKWGFLEHVMRQEIGYFDKVDATSLPARLGTHTTLVRQGLSTILGRQAQFFLILFYANLLMLILNATMGLISVGVSLILVGTAILALRVDKRAQRTALGSFAAAASTASEAVTNIKTVKAFTMESAFEQRFQQAAEDAENATIRAGHLVGLSLGFHALVIFGAIGVVYWFGGRWAGPLTSDKLADAFAQDGSSLLVRVFTRALRVRNVALYCLSFILCLIAFAVTRGMPALLQGQRLKHSYRELLRMFVRQPLIDPNLTEGVNQGISGHIQFTRVSFKYNRDSSKPVFHALDLEIPAGKTTALVGASGCGKSTIVQLVERFYDISAGFLSIDGISIRDYNLFCLRSQMALVSQEPRLFADTIFANIACGAPDATFEEVQAAARMAYADEFIQQLPDKYDTWVGEGGSQLSGGQKQRIAIARALIRNPKVLILDEATSALDNQSEKIVQQALDAVMASGNRTTLIIAHRLSTVRKADRIVVLDNPDGSGAVVAEQGTHDELLRIPNGLYAALVASQTDSNIDRTILLSSTHLKLQAKYSMPTDAQAWELIEPPVPATPKKKLLFKRTVSYVRDQSLFIAVGAVGACITAFTWPAITYFLSRNGTCLFSPDETELHSCSQVKGIFFVVLGVVAFVGAWLQRYGLERAGARLGARVRVSLFHSLMHKTASFFDNPANSPGVLENTLATDVQLLQLWSGANLVTYFAAISSIVASTCIALWADWRMALVTFAGACVMLPTSWINSLLLDKGKIEIGRLRLGRVDLEEEHNGVCVLRSEAVATEAISNIRTVMAYNLEEAMNRKYQAMLQQEYEAGKRTAVITGSIGSLFVCSCLITMAVAAWYYAARNRWAVKNLLDLVEVIDDVAESAYTGLVVQDVTESLRNLLTPLGHQLLAFIIVLTAAMATSPAFYMLAEDVRAKAAAWKIFSIMDAPRPFDEYAEDKEALNSIETIEFHNVAFRFMRRPELPIYRSVSFQVPRGKVIALVGGSGCGKSTAVQLIQRLYVIGEGFTRTDAMGYITLNNRQVDDFSIQSLRSHIGIVSQEPALFYGTVAENIAHGRPGASEEEIAAAARAANAADFIARLPDGYQTNVGRGGCLLSGGQKQRIAIARALLKKPKLLILDEATSALDAESERVVQATLDGLLASREFTTIIIAHRLSTVRKADQIVVLVNADQLGSVVAEVGTHDELMKISGGVYKGLVRIAEGR